MTDSISDSLREEIRDEIDRILRETETATLSIGENLGEIVRRAEEFVGAIKDRMTSLDSGADGGVAGTLDSQCRTVEGFVTDLSAAVEEQSDVADKVIDTSKTVASAAQSVASISMQSRMLCLNTMIEAGRLGNLGRPFMVIADQMRELSEGIARSNEQISKLAVDLIPLLDDVKSNIASLKGRTDAFSEDFEEHRGKIHQVTTSLQETAEASLTLGDDKLASIIERSNSALVDMQLQDIVSQRLRRILRLAEGNDAEDARALADGVDGSGPTAVELMKAGAVTDGYVSEQLEENDEEHDLEAGDMELF